MPPKKLTPTDLVVARFKAAKISQNGLARLLKVDPAAISKWRVRGGRIPNGVDETHRTLLALAKENRVKLSAIELIEGGAL